MRITLVAALIYLIAASQQAFAFGNEGHEIVAGIAYQLLTPTVKNKVDALLQRDDDNLTAKDFISRATWADKFRDSDRNSSHKNYNLSHGWHFVDISISHPNIRSACPDVQAAAGHESDSNSEACIINKTELFLDELASPTISNDEKQKALKFVIHFIGDLHQPLHAADNGDAGGNGLPVKYIKARTQRSNSGNLHGYWDHETVESISRDSGVAAELLLAEVSKSEASIWLKGDPSSWAMESYNLAKSVAYNLNGLQTFQEGSKIGYVLSEEYQRTANDVVRTQLKKAGIRLAYVLNSSLK